MISGMEVLAEYGFEPWLKDACTANNTLMPCRCPASSYPFDFGICEACIAEYWGL
jgi:hypothetical protein